MGRACLPMSVKRTATGNNPVMAGFMSESDYTFGPLGLRC